MSRITKDEYYLEIALAVSKRSSCIRTHYGAVIVKNDRIIGTGYNGAARNEPHCYEKGFCARKDCSRNEGYEKCPAVHAEANAIICAGRSVAGATLYLARESMVGKDGIAHPCKNCGRLIRNAGIVRVVTKNNDFQLL